MLIAWFTGGGMLGPEKATSSFPGYRTDNQPILLVNSFLSRKVLNEKAISLILQCGIPEKLVTCML